MTTENASEIHEEVRGAMNGDPDEFARGLVAEVLTALSEEAHANSVAHGFWSDDEPKETATAVRIALIHSEASEMLEADRKGNPPSEKLKGFSQLEEEAADVLLRVFDLAARLKLRLGEAVLAKHAYNRSRPVKHGGKRY